MYIGIITFLESVIKIRISAIKTYPLKKRVWEKLNLSSNADKSTVKKNPQNSLFLLPLFH